jgi:hypothetical protein
MSGPLERVRSSEPSEVNIGNVAESGRQRGRRLADHPVIAWLASQFRPVRKHGVSAGRVGVAAGQASSGRPSDFQVCNFR